MSDCLEVRAQRHEVRDLNDLRSYVQETICQQNELEVHAFSMTERLLLRSGRPCGIYFCLHGPRSVKFVAIWETERNTVLFYGSGGERVLRSQLAGKPSLKSLAA